MYLISVSLVFQGVVAVLYDPMKIQHGLLVAFNILHWGFVRVCSINLFFFPSSFPITLFNFDLTILIWAFASLKFLGISGQSAHPLLTRLLGAPLGFSTFWLDLLHQEISMASWTARLQPSCLRQGVFITLSVVLPLEELLCLIQVLIELGIICSRFSHVAFFRLLDRQCRLDVFSKSNSSSLWLASVAGPIFALLRLRLTDN